MNLSYRLREIRKKNNISQQEISALINVTPRAWRFYETGDREPSIKALVILADHFNVSVDYLVGMTDDSTPYK
ncbi:MAG: immR [Massilibacillus sp.]|jgi:transcriptional regulator with XRE-family HTH domain|nr:immR [Massilibacillus sp.]